MKKIQEINQPDSCFNRATYQEMMFILLGRDLAAPATIRYWCKLRVRMGKNKVTDEQIVDALKCANQIDIEQR